MSRYFQRGSQSWPAAVATVFLTLVLLAAVLSRPTLGGWTAQITNATNTAGAAAAPQLSCLDSLRTTAEDEGVFLLEPGLVSGALSRVNSQVGSWEGRNFGGSVTNGHPCGQDTAQSLHVQYGLLGLTSQYFQTPTTGSYTRAPQMSTETWFRTSYNQGVIVTLLSPGVLGLGNGVTMAVSINPQGQLTYITNDAATGAGNLNRITGPVVSDGQWHQVVTTWDDATREMNLYLDGNLIDSQSASHDMSNIDDARSTRFYYGNAGNSLLGVLGNLLFGNDTQLRGEVAYAAGWERVLTPAEIAWHWDARNN